MAPLAQLADADGYRACDWDLRADAAGRRYWAALFCWHLDAVLVPLIDEEYAATPGQTATFRRDYLALFERIAVHPAQFERLDVLRFTELRDELLARHGFEDPFRGVKRRENEAALRLLPELLAELDAASPAERQELLVLGLMAGNLFDLGASATIERHRSGQAAFHQARATLPPRPWLVDDVTAWWRWWEAGPHYRHVVFFVDNAGSDIVLGCLPLARWMVQAGARVTLAANSTPSLNDVTAAELAPLLRRCADLDEPLAAAIEEDRLRVAATGSGAPLLDLTGLSEAFVAAMTDADVLILHGMGRAIESNLYARFTCDALWTAVLKDELLAGRMGGKLFDCVFRFGAHLT